MTTLLDKPLFLTEAQVARILGVHPATLHRLAHAGKSPIPVVWVTPSTRRYRRVDVERLAGILEEDAS